MASSREIMRLGWGFWLVTDVAADGTCAYHLRVISWKLRCWLFYRWWRNQADTLKRKNT